jgi:hypothetical protein
VNLYLLLRFQMANYAELGKSSHYWGKTSRDALSPWFEAQAVNTEG